MKITLKQWVKLHELAKAADETLSLLETELCNLVVHDSFKWADEGELMAELSSRVFDARATLASGMYMPQTEWMGGDSSDLRNFTLREPDWVRMGKRFPKEQIDEFRVAQVKDSGETKTPVRDATA